MPDSPLDRYATERVALADLTPHPRNYRNHPPDQLAEIQQSLREFGFYRNVVVSSDGFILAGHGVCEAMEGMDADEVEVYRLPHPHDHPRALKLLAADNELSRRAEVDDRTLTEILRDVREEDESGLSGTGYDEQMLAALLMVTRPHSEIEDMDAAAEWVGMPEYEGEQHETVDLAIKVHFRNQADRDLFAKKLGLTLTDGQRTTWYPAKDQESLTDVRFVAEKA